LHQETHINDGEDDCGMEGIGDNMGKTFISALFLIVHIGSHLKVGNNYERNKYENIINHCAAIL
jgi:hypothetical protein